MKKVKVESLVLDKLNNSPVVILKVEGTKKILPIWIGACEASVIAMILENVSFERPLTHDLLLSMVEGLESKVEKVLINKIVDSTYYAKVILRDLTVTEEENEGYFLEFDARPSDAIILALKTNSPIYISNELYNTYTLQYDGESMDNDSEEFRKFIENLDINEFKKFKKGSQGDN
ncbi:hypothetical protein SU69_00700 [Thermosipho melanesiensis]|uniref:BFN domain-containing protein n=2 Tax=Thermosipho melanesiensis TaxID=46541 RepID=A6LJA4_THEM4|nr:bifunctional nuclease family protein [Thermosipho melanesiensis]ABR30005.1 protein of unknown function DUF151 [Thermosipho melanesiensis BI429]APT73209.1 hypothetical protein BW47_00720 [Thermosipho melanesiensis]OOC38603.1 hypothetical protein SU68_00700 [Thermosipho melanesiensis]OOC40407.1 hypothetical protein SU70_00700 [Thermosipho melanesiensis]OOC40671.1 hypothetical protein SU69_00700 [Thermosipho melanesiensis]